MPYQSRRVVTTLAALVGALQDAKASDEQVVATVMDLTRRGRLRRPSPRPQTDRRAA